MTGVIRVAFTCLWAGFISWSSSAAACAQTQAAPASFVTASATFDGPTAAQAPPETGAFADLQSPLWQTALRATTFENVTTRTPGGEPTEARLLFGPEAIYCLFVVEQRTGQITAKQTTNNVGLGLDDYVSVMFDTSGNGTNQYYFFSSPTGVRNQQASESTRYSPQWTALGKIEGRRWLAEFAIPYRFLRGQGNAWRMNFVRYIADTQQLYTWSYNAQMNNPYGQTFWPSVRNAPAIAKSVAKPTAQIFGLSSTGRNGKVFEGSAGEFNAAHARNVGIDAKLPLTASLNFDGTLNPDFSNVENDQQIIAPQEFRYQYSEYRPFFTQGANYLPGNEIFYSPSIGVFNHGEKLEGQVGHFGLGLLNVGAAGSSDRAYAISYAAPNQETTVGLYGAQADRHGGHDGASEFTLNNTNLQSHVGFGIGTAIESGSFTTDESRARRSFAYSSVNKANYSLFAAYYDVGSQYQPLDAFVSQSDIRGPQFSASLNSTTNAKAAIRTIGVSTNLDRYLDASGAVHEADASLYGYITFKNLLSISAGQSISSLRSYTSTPPVYDGGVTAPYNQSSVFASYRSGTPNNAYVGLSWGAFPSYYLHQLNGSISHQFSGRISTEFDYNQVAERAFSGVSDGQILRRITLAGALSRDQTLNVAYRTIAGSGGFALPGQNFSLGYFRRFGNGSTLQTEIGSPAASRTLDRYVVKYVWLLGSGAGQ